MPQPRSRPAPAPAPSPAATRRRRPRGRSRLPPAPVRSHDQAFEPAFVQHLDAQPPRLLELASGILVRQAEVGASRHRADHLRAERLEPRFRSRGRGRRRVPVSTKVRPSSGRSPLACGTILLPDRPRGSPQPVDQAPAARIAKPLPHRRRHDRADAVDRLELLGRSAVASAASDRSCRARSRAARSPTCGIPRANRRRCERPPARLLQLLQRGSPPTARPSRAASPGCSGSRSHSDAGSVTSPSLDELIERASRRGPRCPCAAATRSAGAARPAPPGTPGWGSASPPPVARGPPVSHTRAACVGGRNGSARRRCQRRRPRPWG